MHNYKITKKDADGTRYEISISNIDGRLVINEVGVILKGKRKPIPIAKKEMAERRHVLNMQERVQFVHDAILKYVPNDLLEEALQDAWKQLQPQGIQFHLPN